MNNPMICPHCKKEVTDDSKFCEFCGNGIKVSYKGVIDQILKEKDRAVLVSTKRKKYFCFFKNAILTLSVFIIATFFLTEAYNLGAESMFLATPITILVSFIYSKIAKKFNL